MGCISIKKIVDGNRVTPLIQQCKASMTQEIFSETYVWDKFRRIKTDVLKYEIPTYNKTFPSGVPSGANMEDMIAI